MGGAVAAGLARALAAETEHKLNLILESATAEEGLGVEDLFKRLDAIIDWGRQEARRRMGEIKEKLRSLVDQLEAGRQDQPKRSVS